MKKIALIFLAFLLGCVEISGVGTVFEKEGIILVNSMDFTVNGKNATQANVNDSVSANVKIVALEGDVIGKLKISVRKDFSWSPDKEYIAQYFDIRISKDDSKVFSVPFVPDQKSGEGAFEGFFIDVYFNDQKILTMQNSYPPRLKIS